LRVHFLLHGERSLAMFGLVHGITDLEAALFSFLDLIEIHAWR